MQTEHIQLPSGESLDTEEIIQGFLLLARNEAPFPVVTRADIYLAISLLIPAIIEYNDDNELL